MQTLSAAVALSLMADGCSSPGSENEAASAGLTEELSPEVQEAAESFEGPFIYWIGLTFPESRNDLEEARIKAWGEKVGVETEIVKVNQNKIVQQVSRSIEANSLPTALTVPYDLMSTMATPKVTEDARNQDEPHAGAGSPVLCARSEPRRGAAAFAR